MSGRVQWTGRQFCVSDPNTLGSESFKTPSLVRPCGLLPAFPPPAVSSGQLGCGSFYWRHLELSDSRALLMLPLQGPPKSSPWENRGPAKGTSCAGAWGSGWGGCRLLYPTEVRVGWAKVGRKSGDGSHSTRAQMVGLGEDGSGAGCPQSREPILASGHPDLSSLGRKGDFEGSVC